MSTARQTTDTATRECAASYLSLAVAVVVSGALRASLLRLSAVFTSTRYADRCAMATCTGVDAAGVVESIARLTLLAATMEMWLEILAAAPSGGSASGAQHRQQQRLSVRWRRAESGSTSIMPSTAARLARCATATGYTVKGIPIAVRLRPRHSQLKATRESRQHSALGPARGSCTVLSISD